MIGVKVKKLTSTATLPTYGSEFAACMDLYADLRDEEEGILIYPHCTVKIGTGLAFEPPKGYNGLIFARSGIATKEGLRPANCVGKCDEDYRGEYIVAIHNDSDYIQEVCHGERIAQLEFVPYEQTTLIEVDELDDTARGSGGFGSSGKM